MELFINNSFDAAFNLALEEVMTRNHDRGFLMLWRNANAVIIGRNQNTAAEINADRVREYQCDVVRRSTGGGAVYHDLGNLNKLPVGRYDVIEVIVTNGEVQYINPEEITIRATPQQTGVFSFSNELEKVGFQFNSELNENPPPKLKKLIKEYIQTH